MRVWLLFKMKSSRRQLQSILSIISNILDRVLEDLFIDRTEGNEVHDGIMNNEEFRKVAGANWIQDVHSRVRHKRCHSSMASGVDSPHLIGG